MGYGAERRLVREGEPGFEFAIGIGFPPTDILELTRIVATAGASNTEAPLSPSEHDRRLARTHEAPTRLAHTITGLTQAPESQDRPAIQPMAHHRASIVGTSPVVRDVGCGEGTR